LRNTWGLMECLMRNTLNMGEVVSYESNWHPQQQVAIDFLANKSGIWEVLYGGGKGGGKSVLGCEWQILRRLKYPGTRSIIGRADLGSLKDSTLETFWIRAHAMGLKIGNGLHYNQQEQRITFNNKSFIMLKDLFAYPSDPYFQDLGSVEITDYFIDEAAEVGKKARDIVRSLVRFKLDEYDLEPKGLLSCNPDKTSWLYTDYYLADIHGTIDPWRKFVRALATDNPWLPSSYHEILDQLSEQDKKRLRDGDWDYDESKDRLYAIDDLYRCFDLGYIGGSDKYITCDVARLGADRTVIGLWVGKTLDKIIVLRQKRTNEVADVVRAMATENGISTHNIICDEDGVGGGVVDQLRCKGFLNGGSPVNKIYVHQKAECYFKLAELITKGQISFVCKEYKDQIVQELELIRRRESGEKKLSVTSKQEIDAKHSISPDIADMIMMRMHFELVPNYGKYAVVRG